MKSITVSAPGKLMLLGEHAVVYGYPCIASTINKYLSVSVKNSKLARDEVITPGVPDQSFVKSAIQVFREKFSIDGSVYLQTQSKLGNFGLGSSAAVTVATIKALALLYKVKLTTEELFNLAYQVVLSIQGRASGFDIATSIYGGTIYFGGKAKETKSLSLVKLPLVVSFTGRKGSTKDMVNKVYELKQKKPKFTATIFKESAQLVELGRKAIKEKSWEKLGEIMDKNQILLKRLQVTTPEIEKLIAAAKQAGAYGAKLSGAGGGDCIIAVVSATRQRQVKKALEENGGKILGLTIGIGKRA